MTNKIGMSILVMFCFFACTKKAEEIPSASRENDKVDKLVELEQNLTKSPSYENYIALGVELASRSRFDEAIAAYGKAVEINPKASISYNNICAAFNAQGRFADAVESCEKAVSLEPTFELAKNNLTLAKEKFGVFRNEMLAKKPELIKNAKTSEDNLNIGMQLFLARDLETANKIWSKIPPSDPFYPAALNNIASSQIIEGKFDEAEKSLNKAMSLQPNNQLFANNKRWLESKKLSK